jgi:hypothetical protein
MAVKGFYTMLNFQLDVLVGRIKITEGDRLCSVRNWFDESVKRDAAWHENINRVRGDMLWILYVQ